ncbi:MAG: hypothetical protein ACP5D7_06760 [Limnospira sp.]
MTYAKICRLDVSFQEADGDTGERGNFRLAFAHRTPAARASPDIDPVAVSGPPPLPTAVNGSVIWGRRQYFITIPAGLEGAAGIDGANPLPTSDRPY